MLEDIEERDFYDFMKKEGFDLEDVSNLSTGGKFPPCLEPIIIDKDLDHIRKFNRSIKKYIKEHFEVSILTIANLLISEVLETGEFLLILQKDLGDLLVKELAEKYHINNEKCINFSTDPTAIKKLMEIFF